jgi:hypothetical protein
MSLIKELEDAFNASFPAHVLEAMVKCIFNAYKIAYDECNQKFTPEEAHDLLPFYRWVQLRMELRGLGGRFQELETTAEPNGASSHIVIDSDRFMLTVSSVDRPGGFPRPANYRYDYANESQLSLFSPFPNNSKVYAVLIHGVDRRDRSKPAFSEIVFPEKGFESYIHKISLFSRLDSSIKPVDEAKPELKEISLQVIKKAQG